MFYQKKKQKRQEINAGSMADIAFLLLIFFLVTTTISAEKGLKVKLPPWTNDPTEDKGLIHDRNLLNVKISKEDKVIVEKAALPLSELRALTYRFINNWGQDPTLSTRPTQAVVSLQNDRATSYEQYIRVYNEIKAAYNQSWEEQAQQRFGRTYEQLPKKAQNSIQKDYPIVISEADPFEY